MDEIEKARQRAEQVKNMKELGVSKENVYPPEMIEMHFRGPDSMPELTEQQKKQIGILNQAAKTMALVISNVCVKSGEKDTAYTALQEALMWSERAVKMYNYTVDAASNVTVN